MPMNESDIRTGLATLSEQVKNMQATVSNVSGKVDTGNQSNNEILQKLAVLNSKQEETSKYQTECDGERRTMREDIIRMKTQSGMISLFISGGFAMATLIVEYMRHA